MKNIVLFVALLLGINPTYAQNKFIGTWYVDKKFADSLTDNCLLIGKQKTTFLASPQLDLICRNKYHGDTLLLYVMQRDCGRFFWPGS